MANRLRVAVIGAGAMGSNHIRVYNELPAAELVAVADPDDNALSAAGVRGYQDYQRLLDEEQVDAVSIAVPTRRHVEVALACIERKVPLLVEKPLAADLAECVRLKAAAEEAGVPLMVGHVERFNPVVVRLKEWLGSGKLGRVHVAFATRVGPFFERERDVGVVHDLATHDIDILRWLFGEIATVHAETQSGIRTDYEDAVMGTLRLETGLIAMLEVNWISPQKFRRLRLVTERGEVEAHYFPQDLALYSTEQPGGKLESEHQLFEGHGEAPLRSELSAFLGVARREQPPPVTAADAVAAMRVVEALIESARDGKIVHLKEARPVT